MECAEKSAFSEKLPTIYNKELSGRTLPPRQQSLAERRDETDSLESEQISASPSLSKTLPSKLIQHPIFALPMQSNKQFFLRPKYNRPINRRSPKSHNELVNMSNSRTQDPISTQEQDVSLPAPAFASTNPHVSSNIPVHSSFVGAANPIPWTISPPHFGRLHGFESNNHNSANVSIIREPGPPQEQTAPIPADDVRVHGTRSKVHWEQSSTVRKSDRATSWSNHPERPLPKKHHSHKVRIGRSRVHFIALDNIARTALLMGMSACFFSVMGSILLNLLFNQVIYSKTLSASDEKTDPDTNYIVYACVFLLISCVLSAIGTMCLNLTCWMSTKVLRSKPSQSKLSRRASSIV